jgi:hypothetical protein
MKVRDKMWTSQSPIQRKALATGVFHCDCNANAPAIFYLDIHSAMKAVIPGVPRHNHCAVEETRATKVFDSRC